MKTLFISHSSQIGGATRSILYAIKKCDNYLLLVPDNGPILDLYKSENINYEVLKVPTIYYSQYSKIGLRTVASFLLRLPNIFKLMKYINNEYKIIHFNEIVFAPTAYLLKLIYGDKIKIVVHARVTMPVYRLGLSRKIFRYMLSKMDYIIAIGNPEFSDLPNGVRKTILTNPVDHGSYNPIFKKSNYLHDKFNISKEYIIAGAFAQIHVGKGQDFILESLAKLNINKKIKIIFFGKGADVYVQSLQNIIKDSIYRDDIIFAGYINNLYECMEGCDFLIRAEDFGLLGRDIMEANSVGLPILTSIDEKQDYSNIIRDGDNAITFKPKNSEDFLSALNLMLENYQKMRCWSVENKFGYVDSGEYCNSLKEIWKVL